MTADAWLATARSIQWSPFVIAPAVGVAAIILSAAANVSLSVTPMCITLSALSVAFIADDPTRPASPASPTSTRTRLATRLAIAGPAAIAGAITMIVVHHQLRAPGPLDLSDIATTNTALAAIALAAAVTAGTRLPTHLSGATGAATVAGLIALQSALPNHWTPDLPWNSDSRPGLPSRSAAPTNPPDADTPAVHSGRRSPVSPPGSAGAADRRPPLPPANTIEAELRVADVATAVIACTGKAPQAGAATGHTDTFIATVQQPPAVSDSSATGFPRSALVHDINRSAWPGPDQGGRPR